MTKQGSLLLHDLLWYSWGHNPRLLKSTSSLPLKQHQTPRGRLFVSRFPVGCVLLEGESPDFSSLCPPGLSTACSIKWKWIVEESAYEKKMHICISCHWSSGYFWIVHSAFKTFHTVLCSLCDGLSGVATRGDPGKQEIQENKAYYAHRSRDTMQGHTGKTRGSEEAESKTEGKAGTSPSLGGPERKARQGGVNSSALASLNDFGGLLALGLVTSSPSPYEEVRRWRLAGRSSARSRKWGRRFTGDAEIRHRCTVRGEALYLVVLTTTLFQYHL